MGKKTRVGVLFGGKSAEHEVSLESARNVVEAIDREKYEVVLIGIDRGGTWHLSAPSRLYVEAAGSALPALTAGDADDGVTLVPQDTGGARLVRSSDNQSLEALDVVFPVLHGPFGEDGTIQGMLKLADIPFVGAGVLGSAVAMDKDVMKRLLREAGIPTPDFVAGSRSCGEIEFDAVVRRLGLPVFVKPANLGSSVGVTRVGGRETFANAVELAFQYDHKILIEANAGGREIEVSVLGNDDPVASVPGEIIPHHDFYTYEAKYIDENGAGLVIPADLPEATVHRVQALAIQAFTTLCCEGMARVDCFLRGEDEVLVNEINTIPGFTRISMYPKLWEASGVSYTELVDRLIQLAFERHGREQRLRTSV
ncbi:MAG: D-alanine--D-alanine ligase [Gemmatimonadetes bacterium]|nr:D-alanine--D-alanine ligase [Gemmatimonadota bacterium]MDE3257958.1 D-alanine--D-alanine ligase [Gemmatimonadota bacterium]